METKQSHTRLSLYIGEERNPGPIWFPSPDINRHNSVLGRTETPSLDGAQLKTPLVKTQISLPCRIVHMQTKHTHTHTNISTDSQSAPPSSLRQASVRPPLQNVPQFIVFAHSAFTCRSLKDQSCFFSPLEHTSLLATLKGILWKRNLNATLDTTAVCKISFIFIQFVSNLHKILSRAWAAEDAACWMCSPSPSEFNTILKCYFFTCSYFLMFVSSEDAMAPFISEASRTENLQQ